MDYRRKLILGLALLTAACGDSDGNAGDRSTGDETSNDGAAPGDASVGEMPETTARVPVPDFGAIAVEPIEEDGSDAGVGVAPNLVEKLDEIRGALPLLEQAKLKLAFMLQSHRLQETAEMNEIFALFEAATARGIEVRPVPVISADEGYFPNAYNHESYGRAVRELVRQWKARGLEPTTLLVDMEPPRELTEALSSLDLVKAAPDEHIDRPRFAAGTEAYVQLVDELHAEGFRVAITTQASLLADYRDGDDDLRQYFNVVIEGPAWDELEFQLYRSAYTRQAPGLGPHFVYDFARAAQARFPGKQLGFAIGVTHPGPIFPDTQTLGSGEELRKDVAAARAAGVSREHIGVYNLKGVLVGPPKCERVLGCAASEYVYGTNDPSDWLEPWSDTTPPSESAATATLWTQLDLMDRLLDAMRAIEEITP
jgi:hypothetical protein